MKSKRGLIDYTILAVAGCYNGFNTNYLSEKIFNGEDLTDALEFLDSWVATFKNMGWYIVKDDRTTENIINAAFNRDRTITVMLKGRNDEVLSSKYCYATLNFILGRKIK